MESSSDDDMGFDLFGDIGVDPELQEKSTFQVQS